MQDRKRLEEQIAQDEKIGTMTSDLDTLLELGREGEDVSADMERDLKVLGAYLEKLETKMLLAGENDARSAIVTIHPGAGGTESQDWAEMLLRMYLRWAENRGYGADILDKLLPLVDVYRALHRSRARRGALDFDAPEAKFRIDDAEHVTHVSGEVRRREHMPTCSFAQGLECLNVAEHPLDGGRHQTRGQGTRRYECIGARAIDALGQTFAPAAEFDIVADAQRRLERVTRDAVLDRFR